MTCVYLVPADSKGEYLSDQSQRFPKEELFHPVPTDLFEHVGHGVPFRISEEGQGFEDVRFAALRLSVLRSKHPQNLLEAVSFGTNVKIHEIAPSPAACDGTDFHAGNIASIGNRNADKWC